MRADRDIPPEDREYAAQLLQIAQEERDELPEGDQEGVAYVVLSALIEMFEDAANGYVTLTGMKTTAEVRQYLANEQALATVMPASPEYQLFTALLRIADACETVEEFVARARKIPIEGPSEETKETRAWLGIALDTVQGENVS